MAGIGHTTGRVDGPIYNSADAYLTTDLAVEVQLRTDEHQPRKDSLVFYMGDPDAMCELAEALLSGANRVRERRRQNELDLARMAALEAEEPPESPHPPGSSHPAS